MSDRAVIAKGVTNPNGERLARYLATSKDNEIAELWQLRGFASEDIVEAFRSVQVIGAATKCRNLFFHVSLRCRQGERLNRSQWEEAVDHVEQMLGLDSQPRAIAFHKDLRTGDEHLHAAWSRICLDTLKAKPLPYFKTRLKAVSREIEIRFGLTPVPNEREGSIRFAPTRAEGEQARRLGVNIHATREAIRQCFERADSGHGFRAALAEQGLILARGDRRDYLVVDRAGGIHAIGKRILGISAAEVRGRLADLAGERLPSVEEARAKLGFRSRQATKDEMVRVEAIERRDPEAMLELLTRYRATFDLRDVYRLIGQNVDKGSERIEFAKQIIAQPQIIRLMDEYRIARYTTQAVLRSEEDVLISAHALAQNGGHGVSARARTSVLGQDKYEGISREQARAVRHATGPGGFALIDGQAGTGKSYTISAVREVYEAEGRAVIGLAPTNAVAQDMSESGFSRSRTLHSELYALENGHTAWDARTVVILDEAAMVDTRHLRRLLTAAAKAGSKIVLVGDDRQLASIERGGMFAVLKEHHGAAVLTEVRRQQRDDDRTASRLMAAGQVLSALKIYEKRGAISWADTQSDAAAALIREWDRDSQVSPGKSRFVFAYTNQDVDALNEGIRRLRVERGELGPSTGFETSYGPAEFSPGDRIQFTGTNKRKGLCNGQVGTIRSMEAKVITVVMDGKRQRVMQFNAEEFRDYRHGYAGTIYKGQGRTLDQTYLFHSEHWRLCASYVALTRHSHEMKLFVARDTATDLNDLAKQMSRSENRRAASQYITRRDRVSQDKLKPEHRGRRKRQETSTELSHLTTRQPPMPCQKSTAEAGTDASNWHVLTEQPQPSFAGAAIDKPNWHALKQQPGPDDDRAGPVSKKSTLTMAFRKAAATLTQNSPRPILRVRRRRAGGTGQFSSSAARLTRRTVAATISAVQPAWEMLEWLNLWAMPNIEQLGHGPFSHHQDFPSAGL